MNEIVNMICPILYHIPIPVFLLDNENIYGNRESDILFEVIDIKLEKSKSTGSNETGQIMVALKDIFSDVEIQKLYQVLNNIERTSKADKGNPQRLSLTLNNSLKSIISLNITKLLLHDRSLSNYYLAWIETDMTEIQNKVTHLESQLLAQQDQLFHSSHLAELGELASSIAHEINQPLSSIRNFARNAQFMLDNDLDSPQEIKSNLKMIVEQVDRAARIITRIRSLSQKSSNTFTTLNINALAYETLNLLKPQLDLHKIDVQISLADDLPHASGDVISFQQVLINLISNAKQAMDGVSTRKLHIKTFFNQSHALPIQLEIEDTGPGFSEEIRQELFKPFFTTKSAGNGMGLGLSISYRIIANMGGRIEAKSEQNKGARFIILLPLVNQDINQGKIKQDDYILDD